MEKKDRKTGLKRSTLKKLTMSAMHGSSESKQDERKYRKLAESVSKQARNERVARKKAKKKVK
jgi:hypothetical protein